MRSGRCPLRRIVAIAFMYAGAATVRRDGGGAIRPYTPTPLPQSSGWVRSHAQVSASACRSRNRAVDPGVRSRSSSRIQCQGKAV